MSAAVYGLARWQPFAPSAAPAAAVAGGDPAAGRTVFTTFCAACHGPAAEGGVGPRLAGSGLTAETVAGVVASGRGIMPAGLVSGTGAADVSAYVASISGAGAPAATTPTPTATAPEAPAGGTARLTGPALSGVTVQLAAPASANWPVRLQGPAGRLQIGVLAAGERRLSVESSRGGRSILDGFDTVTVGVDPAAPDLSGTVASDRADALRTLLVDDPGTSGTESALDLAAAQVAVLHEHVGFLVAARDEGNLPNVRFHGEHMVNITRGAPVRDVDGNGEASNPGDGVGLLGADGWLRRVGALIGPPLTDADRAAAAQAGIIARRGEVAGTSASVAAAAPSVAAIAAADARLRAAWAQLRARARATAAISLEPR